MLTLSEARSRSDKARQGSAGEQGNAERQVLLAQIAQLQRVAQDAAAAAMSASDAAAKAAKATEAAGRSAQQVSGAVAGVAEY